MKSLEGCPWSLVALGVLALSCLGYFVIPSSSQTFLSLLSLYSLQFFLFVWALSGSLRGEIPWRWILASAIGCRVLIWFSQPVLENDYWRYLWDGRVLTHGINPYLFAPLDPALDSLEVNFRHWVGWAQFRTIYPPIAEFIFSGSTLLFGSSVLGLKVILTAFDLGTGLVLFRWLRAEGKNPYWSVAYLLNPLVLKEVANSAHLDPIPVFFSTLALYLFAQSPRQRPLAWGLLSFAFGSKFYPIIFLPLFLKFDRNWRRGILIFVVTMAAYYAPFIHAGSTLFSGVRAYGQYWIFNAGIFQIVTLTIGWFARTLLPSSPGLTAMIQNDYPAKILLGSVFLVAVFCRVRAMRKVEEVGGAALWIVGALLLLSPVVDPWYMLWTLPLACLSGNRAWLAFSYLVIASYAWLYSKGAAPIFRTLEYGIFFFLLISRWRVGQEGFLNIRGAIQSYWRRIFGNGSAVRRAGFVALILLPSLYAQPVRADELGIQRRIDQLFESYQEELHGVPSITVRDLPKGAEPSVLVDVRSPAERAVSMIPGAISKEDFEKDERRYKPYRVITYCTVGYRSGLYTRKQIGKGFSAVNLRGGVLAWAAAGRKFISNSGETKRVHVYGAKWNILSSDYEGVW